MTTQELFDLSGRVALVTGGAGWLGSAMAEGLAEAGAAVAVVDIDAEGVERVCAELTRRGLNAIGRVADTIDEATLRPAIDDIAAEAGGLNILVNCAYRSVGALLDEVTAEQMQEAYRSATAYLSAAQQAVKHMRRQGGGSIINIGSMYGTVTGYPKVYEGVSPPNFITYQASKGAVQHMTRYMAVYWAKDGIRANTISPGPIPDPRKPAYKDKPNFQEFARRLAEATPMGRIGRPVEFKGPVVFLASEASSYITGQNLFVDGGWTAW